MPARAVIASPASPCALRSLCPLRWVLTASADSIECKYLSRECSSVNSVIRKYILLWIPGSAGCAALAARDKMPLSGDAALSSNLVVVTLYWQI